MLAGVGLSSRMRSSSKSSSWWSPECVGWEGLKKGSTGSQLGILLSACSPGLLLTRGLLLTGWQCLSYSAWFLHAHGHPWVRMLSESHCDGTQPQLILVLELQWLPYAPTLGSLFCFKVIKVCFLLLSGNYILRQLSETANGKILFLPVFRGEANC
jgi:hypothetical protein